MHFDGKLGSHKICQLPVAGELGTDNRVAEATFPANQAA